jgi:hydrogenase-4 component H
LTAEKKKFKFSFSINPAECMACAACELECRDGGIFIDDSVNYAINQDNCNRCGRCFRACPTGAVVRTTHA